MALSTLIGVEPHTLSQATAEVLLAEQRLARESIRTSLNAQRSGLIG